MSDTKEPQRALITYRTKPLEADAKWSAWREREIDGALDSTDGMQKFYARPTWPAMTGAVEVKSVSWPDQD